MKLPLLKFIKISFPLSQDKFLSCAKQPLRSAFAVKYSHRCEKRQVSPVGQCENYFMRGSFSMSELSFCADAQSIRIRHALSANTCSGKDRFYNTGTVFLWILCRYAVICKEFITALILIVNTTLYLRIRRLLAKAIFICLLCLGQKTAILFASHPVAGKIVSHPCTR